MSEHGGWTVAELLQLREEANAKIRSLGLRLEVANLSAGDWQAIAQKNEAALAQAKQEARDQQAGKVAEQKRRAWEARKHEKELAQAREEAERLRAGNARPLCEVCGQEPAVDMSPFCDGCAGSIAEMGRNIISGGLEAAVGQASPPACEGEQVDVNYLADVLATAAVKAMTGLPIADRWFHIAVALKPILRRHFPPAAKDAEIASWRVQLDAANDMLAKQGEELAALREENRRLREALGPFAKAWHRPKVDQELKSYFDASELFDVTVGDFGRAAKAMEGK